MNLNEEKIYIFENSKHKADLVSTLSKIQSLGAEISEEENKVAEIELKQTRKTTKLNKLIKTINKKINEKGDLEDTYKQIVDKIRGENAEIVKGNIKDISYIRYLLEHKKLFDENLKEPITLFRIKKENLIGLQEIIKEPTLLDTISNIEYDIITFLCNYNSNNFYLTLFNKDKFDGEYTKIFNRFTKLTPTNLQVFKSNSDFYIDYQNNSKDNIYELKINDPTYLFRITFPNSTLKNYILEIKRQKSAARSRSRMGITSVNSHPSNHNANASPIPTSGSGSGSGHVDAGIEEFPGSAVVTNLTNASIDARRNVRFGAAPAPAGDDEEFPGIDGNNFGGGARKKIYRKKKSSKKKKLTKTKSSKKKKSTKPKSSKKKKKTTKKSNKKLK